MHGDGVGRRVDGFRKSDESTLDTELGRSIGYEFAQYGMSLPADAAEALREGFDEIARSGTRRGAKPSSALDRKLLRLRASAWRRNRVVDASVTTEHLRLIQVRYCPITQCELTSGSNSDTDATIDRVYNGGGYCAGNLAVLSARANRVKANLLPLEIARIAVDDGAEKEDLSRKEWLRMAALTNQVVPMGEKAEMRLPLWVCPPRGVVVTDHWSIVCMLLSVVTHQGSNEERSRIRSVCSGKAQKKVLDDLLQYLAAAMRGARMDLERRGIMSGDLMVGDAWFSDGVLLKFNQWAESLAKNQLMQLVKMAATGAQQGLMMETLRKDDVTNWEERMSTATRGYAVVPSLSA